MKLIAEKPRDTPEQRLELARQLMALIEGERAPSVSNQVPYTIGNDTHTWVLDAHNDWTLLFDDEDTRVMRINHRDHPERADAFCRWAACRLQGIRYEAVQLAVSEDRVYNVPDYKPAVLHLPNLKTLERFARLGRLALLECILKPTGERVAAIVAISPHGKNVQFTPIGIMLNGDPFHLLESPLSITHV